MPHVSLPNESGSSVIRTTKTFGRMCHRLLFCKWAWEIYLCPPTVSWWNKERLWLTGREPEQSRWAPVKIQRRKKKKSGGEKRQQPTRGDAGKVARSPNTKPGEWGIGEGVLAGWSAALTTPGPGTNYRLVWMRVIERDKKNPEACTLPPFSFTSHGFEDRDGATKLRCRYADEEKKKKKRDSS